MLRRSAVSSVAKAASLARLHAARPSGVAGLCAWSQCSDSQPKTTVIDVSQPTPYVFHVILNRPQQRNAFNGALWRELRLVFDYLALNPKCRSIVLSGAGKSFCSGLDLQEGAGKLMSISQDPTLDVARKSRRLRELIGDSQDSFSSLERCPKPVIASIHSHCVGAGINLVAGADIRYASADAVFSIREVAVGLAADVGMLNRVNKIVGSDSLTRELAFTARDMGASEALSYGFISRKFETNEECLAASLALAAEIAERSPIAVQGTKVVLNYARDHTVDDSLNFVRTWNQSHLQSEDLVNAVKAAISKQKPTFNDV